MPYGSQRNLLIVALFANVFTPAKVQLAMPIYMPAPVPPPVYAVPAPVPIAVAIQLPERRTTTTTTTTTPEPPNFAIAMPVPVPMPMPFAVPAPRPPVFCQGKPKPPSCPPCPPCVCLPSCTPAFFSYCSPCHQKCRCRGTGDAPTLLAPNPPNYAPGPAYPIPMPMIPAPVGPQPVVIVPLPPIIKTPIISSSSSDSDDTSDSCDGGSSSNSYYLRSRKKIFRRRPRHYRRNAAYAIGGRDNDEAKPVLSYVSENGDVKFKTKISDRDALEILNGGKIRETGKRHFHNSEEDSEALNGEQKSGRRYGKVLLRDSPTNQVLDKGKSKFIFKPPSNKKINNVAVSFHVT